MSGDDPTISQSRYLRIATPIAMGSIATARENAASTEFTAPGATVSASRWTHSPSGSSEAASTNHLSCARSSPAACRKRMTTDAQAAIASSDDAAENAHESQGRERQPELHPNGLSILLNGGSSSDRLAQQHEQGQRVAATQITGRQRGDGKLAGGKEERDQQEDEEAWNHIPLREIATSRAGERGAVREQVVRRVVLRQQG